MPLNSVRYHYVLAIPSSFFTASPTFGGDGDTSSLLSLQKDPESLCPTFVGELTSGWEKRPRGGVPTMRIHLTSLPFLFLCAMSRYGQTDAPRASDEATLRQYGVKNITTDLVELLDYVCGASSQANSLGMIGEAKLWVHRAVSLSVSGCLGLCDIHTVTECQSRPLRSLTPQLGLAHGTPPPASRQSRERCLHPVPATKSTAHPSRKGRPNIAAILNTSAGLSMARSTTTALGKSTLKTECDVARIVYQPAWMASLLGEGGGCHHDPGSGAAAHHGQEDASEGPECGVQGCYPPTPFLGFCA
ncbi:hypothetical protein BDK51DRAFT_51908 [Blyttiomyces helicus]|uniref:Uncharacterized protein n=1 Tax=Blyttiomyces helicus TaxID=388810 RepID=A0A4P9VU69_9FUNG|nr:hypothetical protein BDK51DRAFT_51908 [Blyttiomyces helicus]|eukprot:RKO83114.1 hypothetical protein BDK51DRAFT_51908 [Blyttiomyces helicus]